MKISSIVAGVIGVLGLLWVFVVPTVDYAVPFTERDGDQVELSDGSIATYIEHDYIKATPVKAYEFTQAHLDLLHPALREVEDAYDDERCSSSQYRNGYVCQSIIQTKREIEREIRSTARDARYYLDIRNYGLSASAFFFLLSAFLFWRHRRRSDD